MAVGLGVAASLRPSGLGVASALASDPLHLRAGVILFYGSVALLLSVLWARLSSDAAAIIRLRDHVTRALILCAVGPLLVLAANWAIVTGVTSDHLALLPAAAPLAIAVLYTVVVHPLSGITGAGLAARLVLRSSYVWLLASAALQFAWVAARVFGDRPDFLWYLERPTVEIALLGFGITAALGVLLTNLNVVYHSRNMAQTLMRTYQAANGLIVLWGLSLMWSIRFPGGYQGLASAVIGIMLMILLAVVVRSSGLLARRNLPWLGSAGDRDGAWASGLASMVMLLVCVTGGLVAVSGVVVAALGDQPPRGLLGAQVVAVGLGIVPLAVAAAVAAMLKRFSIAPAAGSMLVAAGALAGLVLWSVGGLVEHSIAAVTLGAEMVIAVGLLLLVLAIQNVTVPE